jgi:DNA-binding transcriptional MerR regulator
MTDSRRRNSKSVRKPAKPVPTLESIPERGLKIGEAARLLGVEPYVLRFWETQFPVLKPRHTRSRHRFYHARDIATLQVIKRLLHAEGFTIAGANKYIRQHGIDALAHAGEAAQKPTVKDKAESPDGHPPEDSSKARQVLQQVRRELESLHKLLAS